MLRGGSRRGGGRIGGGELLARGRLVAGHTAALVFLAAAAGAEISPSDFGHLANVSSKGRSPCTKPCWPTPSSMSSCSSSTATFRQPPGEQGSAWGGAP